VFEKISAEVTFMKITRNSLSRSSLKWALALVCLITTTAFAGTPQWVAATSAGGTGNDFSYAVKVGPDNRQYVTGNFSGTATFGSTTLTSAGGQDIFLAKYAGPGDLLWIVQSGGASDDRGQALAFDGAGNVYLTGMFTNSATFGSTAGSTITVTGNGITLYLAKYSCSGVLKWVQTGVAQYAAQNNPVGSGVAVNATAGTVYITGYAQDNTTFSSANGTVNTVTGAGTWHMILAKYDTSGNFQWGETNVGEPNCIAYAVAVDASDNAYVTGWLEDTTTFYSANGQNITVTGFSPAQSTSDYPDDAFLVKYDRNGNVKWVNHIGGYKGEGSAVAVSPGGDITLVGFVGNINYGTPGEAETIVTSQPPRENVVLNGGVFTNPFTRDILVVTYNAAGVLQSAHRGGGSDQAVATGMTYDHSGNLYVSGVFLGTASHLTLFVEKSSGKQLLWHKAAGNAGEWNGNNTLISPAVSVDSAGKVFVTSGYEGTASFGGIKLKSSGASSIFLAELAPD
jgi:hypothetical protein